MKKILFAALTALLLVAVCVVGLIPALSRNDEGVIVADQMDAAGATVNANQIKANMATKQTAPSNAVAVGTAAQWAAMTSGGTYKLTANITVTGSLGTASAPFGATIYGNGYTVTASAPLFANAGTLTVYDLTVAGTVTGNGAVAAEAATLTAKNVTISASVTGTGTAGALAGTVATLNANNCINLGAVKGGDIAGGLVGATTGSATLENCSNGDDTFSASLSAAKIMGGLVGSAKGTALTVKNCVNYIDMAIATKNGESVIGGIVGYTDATNAKIELCSNAGVITAPSNADSGMKNAVGGILGSVKGSCTLEIKDCLNVGGVTLTNGGNASWNGAGGILGYDMCISTTITGCVNMGNVGTAGVDINPGCAGILGQIEYTDSANPKQLTVKDCVNSGNVPARRSGGIIGIADSFWGIALIENCSNSGAITATANYAAGIAARLEPKVAPTADMPYTVRFINCVNSGNVSTGGGNCAGGIFGYTTSTTSPILFKNCHNTATISNMTAGGIVANAAGNIVLEDCTNSGTIVGTGTSGGLIGATHAASATLKNCSNDGDVSSNGGHVGGLVGSVKTYAIFTDCVNNGNVSSANAGRFIGGIVGNVDTVEATRTTFTRCVNNGEVNNTKTVSGVAEKSGSIAGGIAARVYQYGGDFYDCVNNGNVYAGSGHAAGMVGELDGPHRMERCVNNGNLSNMEQTLNGSIDVGGMVGRAWTDGGKRTANATYIDCVNTGDIYSIRHAGGMNGWIDNEGTYTNCVNTGDIVAKYCVGGLSGKTGWKAVAISCINTGYIEGGQMVGGMIGSAGAADHFRSQFIGCVSEGDVYHTGLDEATNRGYGVGGIAGYCYNVASFYFNTITGDISGNFASTQSVFENKRAASAIVGYDNGNDGEFLFNYFAGTLDGGAQGIEVLLKTCPGHCICDNSSWGYTYVKWNYTVQDVIIFTEKCVATGTVVPFEMDNVGNHRDYMVYDGWLITQADVANGNLLNTLNNAIANAPGKVSGYADGAFVQVQVCDKINMPVFNGTAALYEEWCGVDHSFNQSKTDAEYHWNECTCGAVSPEGKIPHGFETCTDSGFHWNECADCGYITTKEAHVIVNGRDANEHWSACETCGVEISREKHTYTELVASSTADYYHTTACKCGATSGVDVLHDYVLFVVTDEGHAMSCECGAVSPAGFVAHTAKNATIYKDAEFHWNECICGYEINKAAHAHAEGENATCETKAVCETCGVAYGTINEANHTREIQWTLTEKTHYAWYPCCGTEVETADHVWHDTENVCTVCEMVCEHTGGEATCVAKAVCEHCGKSYGSRNYDNHKNEGTAATCTAQAICADCGEFYGGLNPENHAADCVTEYVLFEGEGTSQHVKRYSSCLQVIVVEDHTVGTVADCDSKTICAVCQLAYGEVDLTNHDAACGMENMVWNTEHDTIATTHKGTYPACGQTFEAAHEFEDGVCTVCGYACVAHVENGETVAVPTTDATTHENRYVCCGGLESVSAHTYENGVCADCGYTCAHAGEFTYAKVSETEHSKTCVICQVVVNEAHTVSVGATCQSKAHCDVCDSDFGEFDATVHNWSETYVVEDERHYKTCLYGCDQISEESAHVYNKYDVTNSTHQKKCVCGDILEGSREAHDMVEMRDENNHWTECVCGRKSEVVAHEYHYENDDTNHWLICSCGLTSGEAEAHTASTAATCQSKAYCAICDSEFGEFDADAHQWSETYVIETDRHYKTCDHGCGEINEGAHVYDEYGVADAIHWMACVCGKENTENTREMHTLVAKTDSDYHWTECFCGYVSEKIAHVFVYECDDENHWLICSCGVTSGEAEAHTASTAATCLNKAHCDVCGNDFGAIDPANHAVTETTLMIDAENGEHYYIHNCCEAEVADSRVACSVGENGTPATCLDAATCGVCGQTFGTVDAANHATTDTTLKTDAENGEHYYTHDCCEAEVAESRVACSAGENGTAPNCQAAGVCGVCGQTFGAVDAANHTTTETTLKIDAENGQHYYTYNCCEAEVADSRVACSVGENGTPATCLAAATCGVCGQTFGTVDAANHVSEETILIAGVAKDQHYYIHTCCRAEVADSRVACSVGENGTVATCTAQAICGVCGEFFGALDPENHATDCEIEYVLIEDGGVSQHGKRYSACLHVVAVEDHTVGTPADCGNKAICAVCQFAYGETDPTVHNWSGEYTQSVDGLSHSKTCANGCGEVETAAHVYDRYMSSNSVHWFACVCGKENLDENTREAHDMVAKVDENNHWTECVCGKSSEAQSHNFTYESNADGHIEKCSCGVTRGTEMAHTFDATTGLCTVCQYACLHDGSFRYVTSETDETKHNVYCSVCDKLYAADAEHGYEDDHFVSDADNHFVACLCGTKQDAVNGGVAHSGGTASCTSRAICSTCGASYGELDPENHADLVGFDYWTDPEDLSKHVKAYDCCGAEVATEGHTYENGECKFCGADCVHTGGTATCKDKAVCTLCGLPYGEVSANAHTYDNACDTACNGCGATREIAHTYGDWKVTTVPTTEAKGVETRTCSVCNATETREIAELTPEEDKMSTGVIVAIVAGGIVAVGAIAAVIVWVVKGRAAAATISGENVSWRTKKYRKPKWKKRK